MNTRRAEVSPPEERNVMTQDEDIADRSMQVSVDEDALLPELVAHLRAHRTNLRQLWAEANDPRGAAFHCTLPDAGRELTAPPHASQPT